MSSIIFQLEKLHIDAHHPVSWNAIVVCSASYIKPAGDMEFKQNKFLPADRQIVTANPDINIVRIFIQHQLFSFYQI